MTDAHAKSFTKPTSRRSLLKGLGAAAVGISLSRQEVARLGRRGAEAQFLQLGHLYRRDDARGLQEGERHRRQYEPVRHQRRAVRQAARRQPGLRRHRSGQRVRRAHDPGRPARAARSRQDPEHQECRARVHQRRAVRSRPQIQHALYLARHRHRLSQVQGQGGPRQLEVPVRFRRVQRPHRRHVGRERAVPQLLQISRPFHQRRPRPS